MQSYRPAVSDYEITLTNFAGEVTDIKRIVAEWNVYEDLFSNVLKADFTIDDAQGLPEVLPIVGDETIDIVFKASIDSEKVKLKFRVYKMDKRKRIEEREHGYVLYATSQEMFDSVMTRANDFFKGKKAHEIVTAIHGTYLSASGKPLDAEETIDPLTFTSASHHPLEICNWAASEAQSAEFPDSSYYLFYEDHIGFKFKSINKLLSEDAVESYWLAEQAAGASMDTDRDGIKQYQVIVGLSFKPSFDIMKGLTGGMLDTKVIHFDPIMKIYQEEDFSYIPDFETVTHIKNAKRILPEEGFFASTNNAGHWRMIHTDANRDENYRDLDGRINESNDPHKYHGSKRHLFLHKGLYQLQSLHQYGLDITVPGNSNLKAGDIINVRIPQNAPVISDATKYLQHFGQEDPQFLVVAVNHNYQQQSGDYYTVLRVVKESFEKKIKVAQ